MNKEEWKDETYSEDLGMITTVGIMLFCGVLFAVVVIAIAG